MADLFKPKYQYCSPGVNDHRHGVIGCEIRLQMSSNHTVVIVFAKFVLLALKYELESVDCAARIFDLEVLPLV